MTVNLKGDENMVHMKNIKKLGDVITFDGYGDETFQCSFHIKTGETKATTKNKHLLGMAKLRLLLLLSEKDELPNELVVMTH